MIQAAGAKRAEKQEDAKTALLEEMTGKAAQLGLSLDAHISKQPDLHATGRKSRHDAGKPVRVKFRGPDDATWTGRGRMPRWLTAAIERGKSKEDFAV